MDTTTLSSVFQSNGPFATALVDVSRDSENGAHEHELHVRQACDALAEQGADEQVVAALRERLLEQSERPAPVSRVVVANADGVLYDEQGGFRVAQPVASWGPLPDLSAWIAHRDSALDFVLALVDHEGGDVAVYDSDVPDPEDETSISNDDAHLKKVPVGGWSALRYNHVTENVWIKNADAVVEQVLRHVRDGHRLVLVGGDPYSKGAVVSALEDVEGVTVVDLESGSRAEDGGDEAQQQAIREALMEQVVTRRLARTHDLQERLGRGEGAVSGVHDVADAFVRGQVDTLLIDPQAAAELELDPADHPGLTLGADTPTGPLRADQALVAAAALTNADVAVGTSATLGRAPVAALLRWSQDAVGSDAR